MTDSLLATKFYPPRVNPAVIVSRPALLERLSQSRAKLVLVSAAAGFGKTTLVLDWIAQAKRNVAWLSLDGRDNDPLVFWRYVVSAMQRASILQADRAAAMLDAQQPAPLREFITVLLNDLAGGEAFDRAPDLLVLDDYQDIEHPEIHQSVNWFLEYLPPQLQVVVTTRSDPPFNLPRLRAHGELLDVRAADLRFRTTEAQELLNERLSLGLKTDEVTVLANRTEGWVAGLQLAAISLKESPNRSQFIQDFAGDDRFIADFLVGEVLNAHPPDRQDFLLQTSILDQFNAELCTHLTGEKQARKLLYEFEQDNVFLVPLDSRREWFRYHRLFADLLQERLLERCSQDELAQRYQKISGWYQGQEMYEQAVDYAHRSGSIQMVLDMLETFGEWYFMNSQLHKFNALLEALPDEDIEKRPRLLIMSAWSLLATGRSQEVEGRLQAFERLCGYQANEMLQLSPDEIASITPQTFSGLIEVAAIRANLAINVFNLEDIFQWGLRVLPYLTDEGQPYIYNPPHHLRPPVLFMLGLGHKFQGGSEEAAYYFQEAIAEARRTENGHVAALAGGHLAEVRILQGQLNAAGRICTQMLEEVHAFGPQATPFSGILEIFLGDIAYERDRVPDARQHYETGLEQVRIWRHFDALVNGYSGMVRIHIAEGDQAAAQAALGELQDLLTNQGGDYMLPAVRAQQAWLDILQGRLHIAENWVHTSGLERMQPVPYLLEKDYLIYVRFLLASQKYEQAREYLKGLQETVRAGGRTGRLIKVLLLLAQAESGLGDRPAASAAIQQAVLLSAPENYVRTFLDECPALSDILDDLLAAGASGAFLSYLAGLIGSEQGRQAPETARQAAEYPGLVEEISPRELEVLHLLEQGLSNKEIADRLTISITTVKSHTGSIYQKLEVANRTRAVARARELGLLGD